MSGTYGPGPVPGGGSVTDPGITYTGALSSPLRYVICPSTAVWDTDVFTSSGQTLIEVPGNTEQASLTAIDYGTIEIIQGGFTLDAVNLTSLTMPNVKHQTGTWNPLLPALTTLDLSAAVGIFSGLVTWLDVSVVETLDLSSVPIIASNSFSPTMPSLASLDMSSLTTVADGVGLDFVAASLSSVSFPALETGGSVAFTVDAATVVSLPALVSCSYFNPTAGAATTVDFSALETATADFNAVMASWVAASFPALVTCGTSFIFEGDAATSLSLAALETVAAGFTVTAASLVTVSLNAGLLSIGGNFSITGAALSQASVNAILVRLAALDGTGGTTSYDNMTVNLSGGTSATPGASGLTAKTTLEGRGNTVTVN